jgi:ABC-type lipoprotein export system ATPase subunit
MSFVLELTDLTKHYRKPGGIVRALDGVSLHVAAGECVVVRGPSGSGKTTLLMAAAGLLAPTRGSVLIDGQNPYALSPERRSRLRAISVGVVFQQFHLIPYLTVLENVLTPSLTASVDSTESRARELIDELDLASRVDHRPAELSTGERQRVSLARALLNRPPLLLADEPTGNLDPDNGARVLRHVADFARSGGAVLMVTHDDAAMSDADRVLHLKNGRF